MDHAQGRMLAQFDKDGSLPHEMFRKTQLHYIMFTLMGWYTLSGMAAKAGVDFWRFRRPGDSVPILKRAAIYAGVGTHTHARTHALHARTHPPTHQKSERERMPGLLVLLLDSTSPHRSCSRPFLPQCRTSVGRGSISRRMRSTWTACFPCTMSLSPTTQTS